MLGRLLFAALTLAAAMPAQADPECGGSELTPELRAAIDNAVAHESGKADEPGVTYQIPVYLHVIRLARGGVGDIAVAQARAVTVDAVNAKFREDRIPFALALKRIDYTTTTTPSYQLTKGSDEENAMFARLNVEGRRNLNLYLVGPSPGGGGIVGWTYPNPVTGGGIVLRYYPKPKALYSATTAAHEVGHWMGLLHTFEYGCGQLLNSDLISDTPTQADDHHMCAPGYDSCPDEPGVDPIDNIMGYSQGCRSTFSAGQIKRMTYLWRVMRGGKSDDDLGDEELVVVDDEDTGGCSAAAGPSGWLMLALVGFVAIRRRPRVDGDQRFRRSISA